MLFHNFELWLKRLENDVVIMISVIFFKKLYGFVRQSPLIQFVLEFTNLTKNKFVIPCVTNWILKI